MADVYIASQTAVVEFDGAPVRIRKGVTRVEDGHPMLKKHPDLFQPAEADVNFPVRTAKAEPKPAAAQESRPAKKAAKAEPKPKD